MNETKTLQKIAALVEAAQRTGHAERLALRLEGAFNSLRHELLKYMMAEDTGRLFCDRCETASKNFMRYRILEQDGRLLAICPECKNTAGPDVVLY